MTFIPQEDKDVHEARQRARQLYEQGLALDAIARSVKTSVMSVLRWRRKQNEDEQQNENRLPSERDARRALGTLEGDTAAAVRSSETLARTPMAG